MDAERTVLRSGVRLRRTSPSHRPKHPAAPTTAPAAAEDAREGEKSAKNPVPNPCAAAHFVCNVCLDTATDPVVTHCGHLFCWPCLYRWVKLHSLFSDCPVCKSAVEIGAEDATVTPIYGAGNTDRTDGEGAGDPPVPPRPQGRHDARPRDTPIGDVIEEMRQRAELLGPRTQMLERTQSVIDWITANLQAIEGLLRDVALRADRLGANHGLSLSAVNGDQINEITNSNEFTVQDNSAGTSAIGRTRRRAGVSGMEGDDGVYQRTRRRRRLAAADL